MTEDRFDLYAELTRNCLSRSDLSGGGPRSG